MRIWRNLTYKIRRMHLRRSFASLGSGSLFLGKGIIVRGSAVHMGSNCTVNNYVLINSKQSEVYIGDNVTLSDFAYMSTLGLDTEKLSMGEKIHVEKPIIVEEGVWIGVRAVILPGVTLGKGSIVAAGAVVTKSVPAGSLVAGVPAEVKKRFGQASSARESQ